MTLPSPGRQPRHLPREQQRARGGGPLPRPQQRRRGAERPRAAGGLHGALPAPASHHRYGSVIFCTVLLRIFARVTEPRCSPGVHAAGVARVGLQGYRPPGHLPGLPDTSSVGEDNIIVISYHTRLSFVNAYS